MEHVVEVVSSEFSRSYRSRLRSEPNMQDTVTLSSAASDGGRQFVVWIELQRKDVTRVSVYRYDEPFQEMEINALMGRVEAALSGSSGSAGEDALPYD
jgi:hypothetical protein